MTNIQSELKSLKDLVVKGETVDVDRELDSLLSSLDSADIDSGSYIESWTSSQITSPTTGPIIISHAYNPGSFRPRCFSLPPNLDELFY